MTESTTAAHRAEMTETVITPVLDVVIPVYNEEADLGVCVRRLHTYLRDGFPFPARITVADLSLIHI